MPVFDNGTILREALWMVPLLVALVVALVVALIGFVGWVVRHAVAIGNQFRADVLARLSSQDSELEAARKEREVDRELARRERSEDRKIMVDIKELLRDEVHKLRERFWHHDTRIARLEEHNGLPPLRHFDPADTRD